MSANQNELVDLCIAEYHKREDDDEARKERELQQKIGRASGEFTTLMGFPMDPSVLEWEHDGKEHKWVVFKLPKVRIGYFTTAKKRNEQRIRYFAAIEDCGACGNPSAVARIRTRADVGSFIVDPPEWECQICANAGVEAGANRIAEMYREATERARAAA